MFLKTIRNFINQHPIISGAIAAALGVACKERLNNPLLGCFFMLSGLKISFEYMYNDIKRLYAQIVSSEPTPHNQTIPKNSFINQPPLISGAIAAALGVVYKEYLNNRIFGCFFLLSGLKISSEYMYRDIKRFYAERVASEPLHQTITQNQLIFTAPHPTQLAHQQSISQCYPRHHNAPPLRPY